MITRATFVLAFALAAALITGCQPPTAADVGARLFADPRFSDSEFNAFSCATCHSGGEDEGAPRIASALTGVVRRASWWGGYAPRLLDAVDFCNVYFMRGDPLDREDPRARALYEYLLSISPAGSDSTPRPLTPVENVTTVARGDPRRGEEVWNASCRICHGDPGTGSGRISELASIVPDASVEFAEQNAFDPALVIIEKVRHGQFFGVGGNMPFYSLENLSDDDLGALIAFLDP